MTVITRSTSKENLQGKITFLTADSVPKHLPIAIASFVCIISMWSFWPESKIKLPELLIKHMPKLKSFVSQNKSVTIVAINVLSKLGVNGGYYSSHERFLSSNQNKQQNQKVQYF